MRGPISRLCASGKNKAGCAISASPTTLERLRRSGQPAAQRKVRFPADQLFAARTRGGERNPAARAGTWGRGDRESSFRRRESLLPRAENRYPNGPREFDCQSWAQFLLKWIVAHPAVTCAIPATSKARHLADNMQGGVGRLARCEDETAHGRVGLATVAAVPLYARGRARGRSLRRTRSR